MRRLIAAVALATCLGIALPAHAQTPAPLTAEQWRADLTFMAREMEQRHKDLYHTVDRERFRAAVAALHDAIPTLQRHQIIVELMRLAAMVGDGHTNIGPLKDPAFGFRSVPLRLYAFDDGVYVRAAKPEHAALVGARIDAIGGVAIDDALRRIAAISARDNDSGVRFYASIFLGMPAIAHALGLSESPDAIELSLTKDGRSWRARVEAGDVDPPWPPDTDVSLVTPDGWTDARTPAPQPLWLQAPLDYHRIVDLPDADALFVQLNMVADTPAQSLAQFGRAIRERVQTPNRKRVVLDLRLNRGGNMDLRYPLIADLIRADDDDTQLFVLVGRGTFSASQAFLDDLDRYTDAVLIGEPASSKPNAFGDSYKTTLPNSGLTVRTSIYWHQLDRRDRAWTGIDVAAPPTFAAYAQGRDPALEAALAYVPAPRLADRAATLAKQDDGALAAAFARYLDDPVNRYADQEAALLAALQRVSSPELAPHAIDAAALASERFPDSVGIWTLNAFIHAAAGRNDAAHAAVRRVLVLDPDNRWVRSLQAKMEPERP